MNKLISIIIILIGLILLGVATTMESYTNRDEFESRVYSLTGSNSDIKTGEFRKLRNSYLTKKYDFQNFGMIFLCTGAFLLVILPKNGLAIKTPKTKFQIGLVGLLAVIITIVGYVGDLLLEMERFRYPPWADSIGIPLMSLPIISLTLSGWFLINLLGLLEPFQPDSSLIMTLKNINYWYLLMIILTFGVILILIYDGDFWWTAAGYIWIYYYLCLLIGRQNGNTNANTAYDAKAC